MRIDSEIAAGAGGELSFGDSIQRSTANVEFGRRPDVAELVQREIPFLRRIVRYWHFNNADAEDLVHDTIVRVLANAHAWEPDTNFRAWVFTIMRNQFRANWARARRDAEAVNQMGCDDEAVDDGCLARLTLRDVQSALDLLSPIQRKAVMRVGIQGGSYESVANEMGISVAAVRCHLARARARLRALAIDGEATSPCSAHALTGKALKALPVE